jgi:hypothetical protein
MYLYVCIGYIYIYIYIHIDPNDRKGKLSKKTCGNGSPTTTYGAPTGDKEFNVIGAGSWRVRMTVRLSGLLEHPL